MPTFRATKKIIIKSRSRRFMEFLEQFITPTPSREKAVALPNLFINPGVARKGPLALVTEFTNPRRRRYGFWKLLTQVLAPEPPRSGFMKVVTSFLDAPVYRLDESKNVIRPRRREANFLQRFISGINEFINARTAFSTLFSRFDTVLEVPSDAFRVALDRLVFASRLRIERLTERLMEGHITPREYQAAMMAEVRRINVAAGLLGIRGIANITPDVLTSIDDQLMKEIGRLQAFLQNSFGPNLNAPLGQNAGISAKQFRAYALKFANAGRATSVIAQNELMQSLYGAGMRLGGRLYNRRVSPNDERTCPDCASWHEIGWLEVSDGGGAPAPTQDCECAQNCRCYLNWCLSMSVGDCPDDIAS